MEVLELKLVSTVDWAASSSGDVSEWFSGVSVAWEAPGVSRVAEWDDPELLTFSFAAETSSTRFS